MAFDIASLRREELLWLYERMVLIRNFEETVRRLVEAGRPLGGHLYVGQEAVAVGVCAHLKPSDFIASTHRGHGHCIAKGVPPHLMMAELYGRITGANKGKGGSMHITGFDVGMLGVNPVVGAGIPHAVGAGQPAPSMEPVARAEVTRPSPPAEVRASPVARRLAAAHGLDLSHIQGTGPGGRIVEADVERALAARQHAPAEAAPTGQTVPFRGIRRTIAERMHQSLQSAAHVTLTMDVDMTEAVQMVGQIREERRRQGLHLTYTDLVVKAVAVALTEHPRLNAVLEGEVIRLLPETHIGVAVALEEGIMVPVVRHADKKSLLEIGSEVQELAAKARAGRLSVDEVMGGTFTVTSLSMYDVDVFTPIINPPQAAVLGVGRIREVPAFEGERVVRKSMMYLSLSFDHRLVDGAPAAQFLRRVRHLLERPALLLL